MDTVAKLLFLKFIINYEDLLHFQIIINVAISKHKSKVSFSFALKTCSSFKRIVFYKVILTRHKSVC